ncbi:MAG: AraC family transcriptional regulator [Clostridia bacterium]|nr:AraC family transcriptional regulator [Clostridia bacterium]
MKNTARYEVQPKSPLKIITYHFENHKKIWRHWHEYLEVIYLVHGEFTLKADDKSFNVSDGDIIVFNPFEVHESVVFSENNEYYVFVIPPDFIQSWQDDKQYKFANVISGNSECKKAIKKAAEATENPSRDQQLLLNAEIFRFLYYAASNYAEISDGEFEIPLKNKHIVEDVKTRIEYCYAEPINIELLANAFFISVSHLQHLFKAQTGISIVEFVNKTRIENSCTLLKNTDLHISAISEKVGIFDYNYFSRMFKKYVGITPTQYRKNSHKNNEEK